MAEKRSLLERVRATLAPVRNVKEKRMFGSVAFMVNDKMCVTVGDHKDHQMMVRIDPAVYEKALRRKGARPAVMRGREYKGYVFLVEEAVRTQRELSYWVGLALDFNLKAKRAKP